MRNIYAMELLNQLNSFLVTRAKLSELPNGLYKISNARLVTCKKDERTWSSVVVVAKKQGDKTSKEFFFPRSFSDHMTENMVTRIIGLRLRKDGAHLAFEM